VQITNDVGGKCNEVGTKMNDCATNFFGKVIKMALVIKETALFICVFAMFITKCGKVKIYLVTVNIESGKVRKKI
jgi:hypothetical protein